MHDTISVCCVCYITAGNMNFWIWIQKKYWSRKIWPSFIRSPRAIILFIKYSPFPPTAMKDQQDRGRREMVIGVLGGYHTYHIMLNNYHQRIANVHSAHIFGLLWPQLLLDGTHPSPSSQCDLTKLAFLCNASFSMNETKNGMKVKPEKDHGQWIVWYNLAWNIIQKQNLHFLQNCVFIIYLP